jgi:ABC-2 type transport system permease protein
VRAIWVLLLREVSAFFNSLIAYLVMGVFLLGIGLFFWVLKANVLESGFAEMNILFIWAPWLYLLLIPALTMRAFSEEFRAGTYEWLATKPLSPWQIVLGKYLAAVVLLLIALLPTLLYYFTLVWLGRPIGNIDAGATWGAYLGLFGIGCVFAAIGIFSSTITDNQIVAFVLGAFLCFLLFVGFDYAADLTGLEGSTAALLQQLGINEHYNSISRGVLDSRDILYYLSMIFFFLLLSRTTLRARHA